MLTAQYLMGGRPLGFHFISRGGCLLGQPHLFVTTNSHPWLDNLLAFIDTCLSSDSLMFSSVAHDPIPLLGSFIPIETLLKKKKIVIML